MQVMKAVYVTGRQGPRIVELPKPEIAGAYDVLIRVTSAGICSSDLEIAQGIHPFARYPIIMGHEFGGIVEAVGDGVQRVRPGDRVTVDPVTSCGKCHSCLRGKRNVCRSLATMGVHRDGGFAQYAVAPEQNVHVFYKTDMDETLLGLAEPYSIGVQINYRAQVKKEDQVMILGSGPIGICAMQEARSRGASVAMTDLVKARLECAKRMGADFTIQAEEEDPVSWALRQYRGDGADVVVDTVGNQTSLTQAMEIAAFGGTVVNISLNQNPVEIRQSEITRKELSIVGSRLNLHHFRHVVDNMENGWFQPQLLRSHTFHFTQIQEAFDLIRSHPEAVMKVALSFE